MSIHIILSARFVKSMGEQILVSRETDLSITGGVIEK